MNEKDLAKVMALKEAETISATGVQAKSIQELYGKIRGRNRAFMRAGIWYSESLKNLQVSDKGIKNAKNAAAALRPHFDDIARTEQIVVLLLDNRNRVLDVACVSGKRHPAGCDLDLRELVRQIVLTNASGIIMGHNHPSNEGEASREDIRMTRDLAQTLSGMGTEVIDHFILLPDGGHVRVSWAA